MLQLVPSCRPLMETERWTILVVEDEPILRDLVRRMLEKRGFIVLTAEDGPSAIEVARAQAQGVDLLLTDVIMPAMNGFEVASSVQAIHPSVRVLYLTGYAPESPYVAQRLADSQGTSLRKPFSQAELLAHVQHLLEQPLLRIVESSTAQPASC